MNSTWTIHLVDDEGNKKLVPILFTKSNILDTLFAVARVFREEWKNGWYPDDVSITVTWG